MRQRVLYLDFLRIFAIAMVVMLHSICDYIVRPEIYGTTSWYMYLFINAFTRTGVPIFLMISGCLILSSDSTNNFKKFYKKTLNRIVIPLVFWNVAYFIYKYIMGYVEFDFKTLFSDFLNAGTEYHLWYLYTLLGIYLLVPFLKKLVDSCNMKQQVWLLFLMLLCTTIRPFVNTITPFYIYFFDALFNGYIGFFFLGYILSKIKITGKISFMFGVAGVIGLIVSVVFHHAKSSSDGIELVLNNGYSFCHLVLAAALFVILRYLLEQKTAKTDIISVFSNLSFGVYLIHIAVIDLILKYCMIDASPIVSSMYTFVLTMVVSFGFSFVLGKIKYIKKTVGM